MGVLDTRMEGWEAISTGRRPAEKPKMTVYPPPGGARARYQACTNPDVHAARPPSRTCDHPRKDNVATSGTTWHMSRVSQALKGDLPGFLTVFCQNVVFDGFLPKLVVLPVIWPRPKDWVSKSPILTDFMTFLHPGPPHCLALAQTIWQKPAKSVVLSVLPVFDVQDTLQGRFTGVLARFLPKITVFGSKSWFWLKNR